MPAYKSSQIVTDKSSFGKRYMPKLDKDGEPIRDPKKIFIGNMGSEISEVDIIQFCMKFGKVVYEEFMYWHEDGKPRGVPRGFCFVEFESAAEAQAAIKALHGKVVRGRSLVAKQAVEREEVTIAALHTDGGVEEGAASTSKTSAAKKTQNLSTKKRKQLAAARIRAKLRKLETSFPTIATDQEREQKRLRAEAQAAASSSSSSRKYKSSASNNNNRKY